MPKTFITTFGFEYREPPNYVDRVYDVRDLYDYPKDPDHKLEQRANDIMNELHPGDNIAVGCDYGHDRSTYIARQIEDNYPDVHVEHLDYDKHSKLVEVAKEKDHAPHEGKLKGSNGRKLSNTQGRGIPREAKGSDYAIQGRQEQEA